MTEPNEIADRVEQVTDGVWHWRIHNANIGGATSSSHAVATEEGCVLIDPVRLADEALATLPPPEAVLLTARTHQRAAWRYRRELVIDVWLPEDAPPADEEPDHHYAAGDLLPGGLRAIRTPGPEWPHYSFLLARDPGVLFCSDLASSDEVELRFIPFEYHEDPAETRRSVERLLDLDFGILCLDHGAPVTDDPKSALRGLLESGS
jgi:glyoxylase-like metal-dependent hydrolase (beta-lactamase superfamily II)